MTEKLFARYRAHFEKKGLITNSGSIIGANFVEVPRATGSGAEFS
jgi:hypothetical protein